MLDSLKTFSKIEKVHKSDYELKKFLEENDREPISNAHYFISKFYDSSDEIRKTRNPHGIPIALMKLKFGTPYIDEDGVNYYWLLSFKDRLYVVNINEYEGSMISLVTDTILDSYDNIFSRESLDFYNNLFNQLYPYRDPIYL